MKNQKFYPKQVMKRLKGRSVGSLDSGERSALSFFLRNNRKLGMSISTINIAKSLDILSASSKEELAAVFANCTAKISVKMA